MFRARATRLHRILVPFVSGAILWSLIATAAFAADKTFSATVSPGPLVAGASYGEGARLASKLTLTLVNESNQAQVGSANVTAPVGITVTAATSSVGTATVVGSVIQLRDLNLQAATPPPSVSVSISARVECGANHGSYIWGFDVRQANNFNGVGNEIAQRGTTTSSISGNCAVVFSKQPKSAENEPAIITSKIYEDQGDPDPTANLVMVTVLDADGLDVVSWWKGTIDLAVGDIPTGGSTSLGGTTSGTTTTGSVQFAPTIALAGSGYSLTATPTPSDTASSGVIVSPAKESDNFNIVDDAGVCEAANGKCHAESQGPKTNIFVEADGAIGAAAGDLVILTINEAGVQAPSCAGYTPINPSEFFAFVVTTSNGTTISIRPKTATLTLGAQFVTQSASKYQVCFQGASGSARLLSACANKNPVLPCIMSKGLDKQKNLVIVVAAPGGGGDPKVQF
jgi:hypothetical protein